ncbi:MAG: hypothetical protein IPJ65_11025 [Archangiaceae bacterium]|nr:hypothetical protein [Archangiaceae bacterium]
MKAQNEDVEEGENEGEGNRTADRNYRAGVEKTVKSGKVEAGAKKAEEALEDDEQREELEEAERDARKSQVH